MFLATGTNKDIYSMYIHTATESNFVFNLSLLFHFYSHCLATIVSKYFDFLVDLWLLWTSSRSQTQRQTPIECRRDSLMIIWAIVSCSFILGLGFFFFFEFFRLILVPDRTEFWQLVTGNILSLMKLVFVAIQGHNK